MKKFISWVSAVAVLISVLSCRETEELLAVPDEIQNQSISAKVEKDSTVIDLSTTTDFNSSAMQESDPPPKKDEIKW